MQHIHIRQCCHLVTASFSHSAVIVTVSAAI